MFETLSATIKIILFDKEEYGKTVSHTGEGPTLIEAYRSWIKKVPLAKKKRALQELSNQVSSLHAHLQKEIKLCQ